MRSLGNSGVPGNSVRLSEFVGDSCSTTRMPAFGQGALLRQELIARNIQWAEQHAFLYEQAMGPSAAVLYRPDPQGRHGNFHPASYRRILRNPAWSRRLSKVHTTAHKCLVSHDRERRELDSCNSSDALLMNIFCHPSASLAQSELRAYLNVEPGVPLLFGYKPRIPLRTRGTDCTEVDLRIGDLMIEAKLTESDFQVAPWKRAERYRDFEDVFDPGLLPRSNDKLHSYQLVRGILAAFAEESARYCLICDGRRTDLIELWAQVLRSIRTNDRRWRCVLVTWQELSPTLPKSLQNWLQEKFGITSPRGDKLPGRVLIRMPSGP